MGGRFNVTFIILIIILNLASLLEVQDTRFTHGVNKDDVLIWECNVCDNYEMNEIFGTMWDDDGFFENLSLNRKMKWKIDQIDSNLTSLEVNISVWIWRDLENWDIEDKKLTLVQSINPNDYQNNLSFTNAFPFIPIWFPVPVGDYLGELKLSEIYDVDNRVLATININMDKDAISLNNPSKSISIIAIYNSKGILNTYKLYIGDYIVVLDMSLVDIPLYTIPSTIGLISVFLLSICVYIYKKYKKGVNSKK